MGDKRRENILEQNLGSENYLSQPQQIKKIHTKISKVVIKGIKNNVLVHIYYLGEGNLSNKKGLIQKDRKKKKRNIKYVRNRNKKKNIAIKSVVSVSKCEWINTLC